MAAPRDSPDQPPLLANTKIFQQTIEASSPSLIPTRFLKCFPERPSRRHKERADPLRRPIFAIAARTDSNQFLVAREQAETGVNLEASAIRTASIWRSASASSVPFLTHGIALPASIGETKRFVSS